MTTKQRYEGIQTSFQNANLYGCLFLSLLSIAEEYTHEKIDFIEAYRRCRSRGFIDDDFFCKDQEAILYDLTGTKWKKKVMLKLPEIVPDLMYTVEKWYNPRTNLTHFKRRGFDTLSASVTVREGYIKEYYTYTAEE